ncbi:MAG: malate dehydrogenase, partial [Planctomycetes bacterium]|nr:malate dehydrogenase [Planctomycetota bacterium]
VLYKQSGLPRNQVMGMAGVLDSTRFRTFLAGALGCDPKYVSAMVLGGHGDNMVPITRTATVSGVPIAELLDQETIDAIVERTRKAGGEVVKLLRTGSAFSSTGAAICEMVEPCLTGQPRLLPVCTYLEGEYGFEGISLGVPALIGKDGVEKIIDLDLTAEEKAALEKSAAGVRQGIESLSAEDLG